MNQTVKIFFTDMDDTLLNSEKQVTKENMDAISEALAAGHKIVFCHRKKTPDILHKRI